MRGHRQLALIAAIFLFLAHNALAQEIVHRVGFLTSREEPDTKNAFTDELRDRGFVAGRNLQLDFRYTQGESERIPALINELVALHPEIIVTNGPQNAIAVHNAVPAIPLVFTGVASPVAAGLVQSLAHPGGNVTGFATLFPEDFGAKRIQLLKEVVPTAQRIAVLLNPTNQMAVRALAALPDTARRLAIELFPVEASKPEQLETAFETAHAKGADAIDVFGDALLVREAQKIADLANKYRLPAMYLWRPHVVQGGLMSYGPDRLEYYRGSAAYVAKILDGAKPSELPVELPSHFQLIINLKTAKALGLTMPPDLLVQAAELIE